MSAKKEKIETLDLAYRISKIQTTKFVFEEIDQKRIVELFSDRKDLNLTVNIGTLAEVDELKFTVDLGTKLEDKTTKIVLVEHVARTIFHIDGLNSIYNPKTKFVDFPTPLIIQIYGIAFSHARALLAIDIAPTCYRDKYMLPVIDPTTLIDQSNVR